ncbi:MAG: ankyrin repeat domain-containing protein [Treponema sp.]|nr:ankyrin repeat domain-containing protein [Treponema sp.]
MKNILLTFALFFCLVTPVFSEQTFFYDGKDAWSIWDLEEEVLKCDPELPQKLEEFASMNFSEDYDFDGFYSSRYLYYFLNQRTNKDEGPTILEKYVALENYDVVSYLLKNFYSYFGWMDYYVGEGYEKSDPMMLALSTKNPRMIELALKFVPWFDQKFAQNLCDEYRPVLTEPLSEPDFEVAKGVAKYCNSYLNGVKDVKEYFSFVQKNYDFIEFSAKNGLLDLQKVFPRNSYFSTMNFSLLSAMLNTGTENKFSKEFPEEFRFKFARLLLDCGADINAVDEDNRTALFYASLSGAAFLIEKGIDVTKIDEYKDTALIYAIKARKDYDLAELLAKTRCLDILNGNGHSALTEAILEKQFEFAKKLILAGADVNAASEKGLTPVYCACDKSNLELVKMLVERGARVDIPCATAYYPHWPLCAAMYPDNYELVEYLLEHGAKVNMADYGEETELFNVDSCKDLRIPLLLLKKGADVNYRNKIGLTPLLEAAVFARRDLIDLYMKYKPNFKAVTNDGDNMIHLMIRGSLPHTVSFPHHLEGVVGKGFDEEMLKFLKKKKVPINGKNKRGETPFMLVCQNEFDTTEYLDMFLRNGAKINEKDNDGETGLFYCLTKHQKLKYLIEHGADVNVRNKDGDTALDICSREAKKYRGALGEKYKKSCEILQETMKK